MTKTIKKKDIAHQIHRQVGIPCQEAVLIIDEVLHQMTETLAQGKKVKLSSFASFVPHDKKKRIGRNPKTLQEAVITQRKVVLFKPSYQLKRKVNL